MVCGGLCWDGRGGAGHNLRVNNSTAVQPGWAVGIGDRKRFPPPNSATGARVCCDSPWCLGWGGFGLGLDAVCVWLSTHGVRLAGPSSRGFTLEQRGDGRTGCADLQEWPPGCAVLQLCGFTTSRGAQVVLGVLWSPPAWGEKANRRWILGGVTIFSCWRKISAFHLPCKDEWELLGGPPVHPVLIVSFTSLPPPHPVLCVRAAIMQSCNQGAELAAHLGLISEGCKFVPTGKEERRGTRLRSPLVPAALTAQR